MGGVRGAELEAGAGPPRAARVANRGAALTGVRPGPRRRPGAAPRRPATWLLLRGIRRRLPRTGRADRDPRARRRAAPSPGRKKLRGLRYGGVECGRCAGRPPPPTRRGPRPKDTSNRDPEVL